jgi:16S rRNA (guanine1516-N2)-methyltransferase
LARAVGLRGGARPSVLDATAGLGRDGFELAGLGCQVTLLERSPVVHALLRDGLARAQVSAATTCERINLHLADAAEVLTDLAGNTAVRHPDVVYLDPMHPPRDKAALVRKEMRLLRAAVGDDADAAALIEPALVVARQRVVVKRPLRAEALDGRTPDWSVSGRTTRYDIYRVSSPDTK